MRLLGDLFDRDVFGRILRNSGWLLLERLVRLTVALAVNAWVARYLGPSQFGELAFVLAILSFFVAATNLGLDAIVVRDITHDPSSTPVTLGTVFVARAVSGVVGWGAAVASTAVATEADTRVMALAALAGASVVFQAADVIDLWFQSGSRSKLTVLPKLLAFGTVTALKVFLILTQAPLEAFAVVTSVEAAAVAAGLVLVYRRRPTAGAWTFSSVRLSGLLNESWPLILSSVAVMVYMRIDQVLIRNMLGQYELGLYAAALSVSQVWHFIPALFAISLIPYVSARSADRTEAERARFVWIFRLYFLTALVLAAVVSVLAPQIIRALYGAEYIGSVEPLRIHVFSNVFIFLGMAHSLWLTYSRQTSVRLAGTVIAGLFSVAGNLMFVPLFGLTGAAIVAVVSQFIAALVINAILSRESFWMQLEAIGLLRLRDAWATK